MAEPENASLPPIAGPFTFAIVDEAHLSWPMSNYRTGGCKHDVTHPGDDRLGKGLPWPCENCGCLLIPARTLRRVLAQFEVDQDFGSAAEEVIAEQAAEIAELRELVAAYSETGRALAGARNRWLTASS